MKKVIFLLLLLVVQAAQGVSFHDIEEWDHTKLYNRGEVVRLDYDLYISVLPTKDDNPQDHQLRWRKIKHDRYSQFEEKRLYFLGKVVSHSEKFYVSAGINVPFSASDLEDSDRWVEVSHPGFYYDVPDYDEDSDQMESLLGVDSNGNGIRDDYEDSILFSKYPDTVKQYALDAGKVYGELMETAKNKDQTSEALTDLGKGLVNAEACKREMKRQHNGVAWNDTQYFDTLNRIEAKYKLQNIVSRRVEESQIVPSENPCYDISVM